MKNKIIKKGGEKGKESTAEFLAPLHRSSCS
jgi:hypothetical protein